MVLVSRAEQKIPSGPSDKVTVHVVAKQQHGGRRWIRYLVGLLLLLLYPFGAFAAFTGPVAVNHSDYFA